jgi:hypothetical protein
MFIFLTKKRVIRRKKKTFFAFDEKTDCAGISLYFSTKIPPCLLISFKTQSFNVFIFGRSLMTSFAFFFPSVNIKKAESFVLSFFVYSFFYFKHISFMNISIVWMRFFVFNKNLINQSQTTTTFSLGTSPKAKAVWLIDYIVQNLSIAVFVV